MSSPSFAQELSPDDYSSLKYRHIGPEGNRVIAIAGHCGNPHLIYAGAASGSQSAEDMRHTMVQDWVIVSSDGGALPIVQDTDKPVRGHPRGFGSQTIVFRKFVREEKLLTYEDAVRKMTSLPAQFLKMNDRGLLVEGYKADVTIFNPETVRDNATYDNAFEYATGIEYVIVNGKVSVDKGKFNGALNGKVLLKPQR